MKTTRLTGDSLAPVINFRRNLSRLGSLAWTQLYVIPTHIQSILFQYGVCLFLVFILEASASIAAFVMQSQVREMLIRTMNDSLAQYETNDYIRTGVDFMQGGLECCGVDGPRDWIKYIEQTNATTSNGEEKIDVPSSCCGLFDPYDIKECERQYENGCLGRMDFIISQSTMLIATGATTVAFVQV